MSLLQNLSKNFETFTNADQQLPETKDLNDSLDFAIISHVVSPDSGRAFVSSGFGETWRSSFKLPGQPTAEMQSVCTYINSEIKPAISKALAYQILNCSVLMNGAAPPVAQSSALIVASALSKFPAGQGISTTMNASVSSATSTGNLAAIPVAVSLALNKLSTEILNDITISDVKEVQSLDGDLESSGLSGTKSQRVDAWKKAEVDILSTKVPINIYPTQEGLKYWNSILQTIAEAIPKQ